MGRYVTFTSFPPVLFFSCHYASGTIKHTALTFNQVVAIIDIDCAELNGFTTEDQEALEELAQVLAESCDF